MSETNRPRIDRRRVPLSQAAWRAGALGRCPHCGQTSMFKGYYDMHRRCAVCDLRYETESGAWLGALALGYGIGALAAIILAAIEVTWAPIRGIGWDPMWTIAILALIATAVGYRPAKQAWLFLLYYFGFMAFGDDPPGPRPGE